MDRGIRGRGRTPQGRGRNTSMRWSPRSYDQSKNPHDPVVGWRSYQQTSGDSFYQSPDSQASHYYKQSSSSSCEVDDESDESVKATIYQPEQDVSDTLSSSFSKLITKSETELPLNQSRNPTLGHKTKETENPASVHPYDICRPMRSPSIVLKPSILERNRERRNEAKRNVDMTSRAVLRPGMVLLKGYISLSDQVKIVEICRQLGVGPGGFYQPGYSDGTKLHLKMMCLGKNWDPQTRQYGDHRPFDRAKPPSIPVEILQITEKAIKDSHVLISNGSKRRNAENILPWMSPDICLVNFYTRDGHLGLHQDKDESEESLRQGLPVVSFSIGESADFLYGDERDVDKAQRVVLESGDVLIFGGDSRHIFHGVTVIHPNTAPRLLMDDTNLRPGRLNLTLRQY